MFPFQPPFGSTWDVTSHGPITPGLSEENLIESCYRIATCLNARKELTL